MFDEAPHSKLDRIFFFLLTPLVALSLPSLLYCALEMAVWLVGGLKGGQAMLRRPPENGWVGLVAMQTAVYEWVLRLNSPATLAATGLFVVTLVWPRWRHWIGLALIPYGLLLCADFTLRWHSSLLP